MHKAGCLNEVMMSKVCFLAGAQTGGVGPDEWGGAVHQRLAGKAQRTPRSIRAVNVSSILINYKGKKNW